MSIIVFAGRGVRYVRVCAILFWNSIDVFIVFVSIPWDYCMCDTTATTTSAILAATRGRPGYRGRFHRTPLISHDLIAKAFRAPFLE